jgi:hypothetical protein
MALLTVEIEGRDCVYEGSLEELSEILVKLTNLTKEKKPVSMQGKQKKTEKLAIDELYDRIPNKDTIKGYILSNPSLEYTMHEIEDRFLGTCVTSKGETERIFRRLYAHIEEAKKEIEKEKGGEFVGEMKYPHGKPKYKIYRFVPEKEEAKEGEEGISE